MSFGKMNTNIEIISTDPVKDQEGFVTQGDTVVANVRAYFEQKNSSEKWLNMSENTAVNALFRLRAIPHLILTNKYDIICNGKRYNIFSVENVRNRSLYYEILAVSVNG